MWASDKLPTHTFSKPAYFIVNTHPNHLPGEHWLTLTVEENVVSTFFDSFGLSPESLHYPQTILHFLQRGSRFIYYHDRQIQHPLSIVCGEHCIFQLFHRAQGLSYQSVLNLYDDNYAKNDLMASNFVKCYKRLYKTVSTLAFVL